MKMSLNALREARRVGQAEWDRMMQGCLALSEASEQHPVLQKITKRDIFRHGVGACIDLMEMRKRIIESEKKNPLDHGWEPFGWKLMDALYGFDWVDESYAERIRDKLGFGEPVDTICLNGGNRASKTEYAARTTVKLMITKPGITAWCFDHKSKSSIANQQKKVYKYLDQKYKGKKILTETTYISFKQQTGFAPGGFTIDNSSDCQFLNYEMNMDSFEGLNPYWAAADELSPLDLAQTLEYRVAERDGKILYSFTPKNGYTAMVADFSEGATPVLETPGFLLPKDGGEVREDLAVVGDDWRKMVEGDLTYEEFLAEKAPGRVFERMPRVMKCAPTLVNNEQFTNRAMVFFHTSDNPYGNPPGILKRVRGTPDEIVRMRWYGKATKSYSSKFNFDDKVHVVAPEQVPHGGYTVMVVDPAAARNFFITWIKLVPEHGIFVIDEWPNQDLVPEYGFLGPWALPAQVDAQSRKKGIDGRRGPAQEDLKFGLCDYKLQIAKIEGWRDLDTFDVDDFESRMEWIRHLAEERGSLYDVRQRFMDSRFGHGKKRVDEGDPITLIEEFYDWGLFFEPASGKKHDSGTRLVDQLLTFDPTKPINYFNRPLLRFSSRCQNTIFAVKTWTGADGQQGATKDPIDNLVYFAQTGLHKQLGIDEPEEIEGPRGYLKQVGLGSRGY